MKDDEIVAFGFFEDKYPLIVPQDEARSEILEPLTVNDLIRLVNSLSKELENIEGKNNENY